MRYYVVEFGYSHYFRFDNPADAAGFMARAAETLVVESRNNRESIELVIVDEPEPETEELDPEIVRPGELDLPFEEVANDNM